MSMQGFTPHFEREKIHPARVVCEFLFVCDQRADHCLRDPEAASRHS